MRYLACTPLDTLTTAQQADFAADVGLAAVLGDDVYNLGELLQHPVLGVLAGTPRAWVRDLLEVFSTGDIAGFERIAAERASDPAASALAERRAKLDTKIRVLALVEAVFSRDTGERSLKFDEVAATCRVPLLDVELLLMRAFSLDVVRGSIDQVEEVVRFTWVQPRVLSDTQLAALRGRLTTWSRDIQETMVYVEVNAPELVRQE